MEANEVQQILEQVKSSDTNIVEKAVLSLNDLMDRGADGIQLAIDQGVVPIITPMLGHAEDKLQTAALWALGNILTGSDQQTQLVLDQNALNFLPNLLMHANLNIRCDALWFVSNITAGNRQQIQAVIDAGLLPIIIDNLSMDDYPIQLQAAWAITNLTFGGTREQTLTLVRGKVIPAFYNLLAYQDSEIILLVLEGLSNMLVIAERHVQMVAELIAECDGLQKLRSLLSHGNVNIFSLANEILSNYFSDDEHDENGFPANVPLYINEDPVN